MMSRSDLLWSGAVLALIVLSALSLLPVGLAPPLRTAPTSMPEPGPVDPAPWANWLEARIQPPTAAPIRQAAPVDELAGYTLVGLVEVDGRMLAMIAGNGGTRSLAVGGTLDGYEAMVIEADHIVLARDGNEITLRLDR
ncbi:hypothetical protein [Maricaulis sp.]|uniref:hypothetical protein n=1 Tax=Maricaulis sp. TaxID=1486257 RepID=UPI003A91066C